MITTESSSNTLVVTATSGAYQTITLISESHSRTLENDRINGETDICPTFFNIFKHK